MAAETAIAQGVPDAPQRIGAASRPETDREGRPVSDRILRLRRRLLKETPVVSIERARYYTEHWRSTEESGLAPGIRVALAMRHVYERMHHQVDPDDGIAGAWTENPIGIPLDIERGLFNRVFAIECSRLSMLWFQAKANLKFFAFMLRRVGPLALYHRLKQLKAFGAAMPSIGLEPTVQHRFLLALLALLKQRGVHTALETCGHFDASLIAELTAVVDLFLYDVKHISGEAHSAHTGVDTEKILSNFRTLLERAGPDRMIPRIPLIPGFNTGADAFDGILAFLLDSGYRGAVHLMPYNNMSRTKYHKIGKDERYRDMGTLDDEVLERCVRAIEARHLTAVCNH